MFVDVLPRWERNAYWIIGIASMAYSYYALYVDGNKLQDSLKYANLIDGWRWLGRKQDVTGTSWQLWRITTWNILLIHFVRIILSLSLRFFKVGQKIWSFILLMFDVSTITFIFGMRPVILLLFETVLMYLATFTGSTLFVWLITTAMIATLNFDSLHIAQLKILELHPIMLAQYDGIVSWHFCRLVGFATEKITRRRQNASSNVARDENPASNRPESSVHKQENTAACDSQFSLAKGKSSSHQPGNQLHGLHNDPNLLDSMSYSFYLPVFFFGPIISYKDFHNQTRASLSSDVFNVDVCDICKTLMKIAFWTFFVDFQYHYLYYDAFVLDGMITKNLSLWSVVAIAYGYSQLFMIKYVCRYGLNVQLSRFDGLEPIPYPRCTGWMLNSSDAWKHFDVGLYNFVKHHIYIPLGGSRAGFARQVLASSIVFLFVFWWHGNNQGNFVWCLGNVAMIVLNTVLPVLGGTFIGAKVLSFVSPAMRLRLRAMIGVPERMVDTLLSLWFFFGSSGGYEFFVRIVLKATWTELIAECFFVMVFAQNALFLRARHKDKEHKQ